MRIRVVWATWEVSPGVGVEGRPHQHLLWNVLSLSPEWEPFSPFSDPWLQHRLGSDRIRAGAGFGCATWEALLEKIRIWLHRRNVETARGVGGWGELGPGEPLGLVAGGRGLGLTSVREGAGCADFRPGKARAWRPEGPGETIWGLHADPSREEPEERRSLCGVWRPSARPGSSALSHAESLRGSQRGSAGVPWRLLVKVGIQPLGETAGTPGREVPTPHGGRVGLPRPTALCLSHCQPAASGYRGVWSSSLSLFPPPLCL